MAIYDFRACLSSIYDRTSEKAIYIGYGMGSTISYVYSSLFPEESTTYLKGMISLGPFATINNIRSTLRQIVPIWPIIRPIFKIIFGNYFPRVNTFVEFFSSTPDRWFILDLVERAPVIGPDFEQIDPLYKPVQSFLFDDSIPIGIIDHFAAIGRAKSFIQKDYGTEKNMEIYGSKTPPVYDLSKIVVPVAFFLGKQDYLADPADAIYIYGNITNDNAQCGYTFIKRDKWNHGDFIWAKDMVELMVKPVMEKINQFENGICQKY
ncbi:unnamed protein product [Psylliodes chrysocephalus]|uniref:Uncharacterized protein n=1 Tax=Psylliodes chrysocephalus TaxID=3402493 RepID=A0A9P0CZI9_9CUCU|nr:unnamed protein product [Psylliodes chrysocephala]